MAVCSHAFYQFKSKEWRRLVCGFFLRFLCFGFLKIQLIFFKGKIEVHVSEINGKIQWFSFLPRAYLLCGMATTAPQLLPSTAAPHTFLIAGCLLLKHLILVGLKNENIPTIFFSCNCIREGCTSAARGCSTSVQETPQSRNIYVHRRHWCSVLNTVAWRPGHGTCSLSSQWY